MTEFLRNLSSLESSSIKKLDNPSLNTTYLLSLLSRKLNSKWGFKSIKCLRNPHTIWYNVFGRYLCILPLATSCTNLASQ
ncbi:uncharacterized protein LOC141892208 isoform X2 [Acropora palmata]|uniref:uncharacterized protein LOC141892208 isoform X2 n=1 Tax=Acropora palmata TaxID=6131 RepID=UPI003DA0AB06